MLDEEMRRLPAVQTASMGVIPDPRLASWAEMCAIGRAFVVRHPTKCYAPTSDEFKEMVAVYLGAPSPLTTQIGVGRRVRCPDTRRANLTLDKWGFALLVGQEPRGSTYAWRSHHDAVAHVIYGDATRAGIEGRSEVRGLFSSLLPPANARRHRGERDGLVPDVLLRRPTEPDAVYKDHLHDMKIIHVAPSTYSDAMVKEKGVARSANAQADKVNEQYLTKARKLDTECFSSELDVEARHASSGGSDRAPKSAGNAWAPSRSAARTAIRCYGRRPGARPCATGDKSGSYLWRRLSRPTRTQLGTAAIRELN